MLFTSYQVQEHESKKFLSYFKSGIQYLEGGVATGFKKVEKENIQRLIKVKGSFNPRIIVVSISKRTFERIR